MSDWNWKRVADEWEVSDRLGRGWERERQRKRRSKTIGTAIGLFFRRRKVQQVEADPKHLDLR